MDYSGLVVVVTGASEGIGLDVARALAMRGSNVVLAARTESKLAAAAASLSGLNEKSKLLAVATDVTKRADHSAVGIASSAFLPRLCFAYFGTFLLFCFQAPTLRWSSCLPQHCACLARSMFGLIMLDVAV